MPSTSQNPLYPELMRAAKVGEKYLVPMPRVASSSMMQWAELAGFQHVKPSEVAGEIATFVRNPYDHVVSAHAFIWSHMAFEDLVWCLRDGEPMYVEDVHLKPQSELIQDPAFLGRHESLTRDWRRFCEWAEVEYRPLPVSNKSMRMPTEMYYSPRLRDIVADFYRQDFEVYGYSDRLEARRPDAQRSCRAIDRRSA